MLTSSALYRRALHFPHKIRTIADVRNANGDLLYAELPISTGSVGASLTQRVTRSAALTLSEEFYPDLDTDPLSPNHAILHIRAGIQYQDGSEEIFPLFVGRVQDVTLNPAGDVAISAQDQAADVIAFRFRQPRNADRPTVLDQIETLISEAVPGATFGTHDVADAPTPQLTWDEDRGQAIDDLAEALGARWYTLGDGSFVVRAFPYDNGTVVQDIRDGYHPDGRQGLMSQATITRSRAGVSNSITVVSERTDGTDPVRVTQENTVPTSPTRFGDEFGRVSEIIKIQTPLTNSEAQRLARAQLNAATALNAQWSAACVADFTLEPGDPVRLQYRGRNTVQVIDQITYPLVPGGMSLATRAFTVPPVTIGT